MRTQPCRRLKDGFAVLRITKRKEAVIRLVSGANGLECGFSNTSKYEIVSERFGWKNREEVLNRFSEPSVYTFE